MKILKKLNKVIPKKIRKILKKKLSKEPPVKHAWMTYKRNKDTYTRNTYLTLVVFIDGRSSNMLEEVMESIDMQSFPIRYVFVQINKGDTDREKMLSRYPYIRIIKEDAELNNNLHNLLSTLDCSHIYFNDGNHVLNENFFLESIRAFNNKGQQHPVIVNKMYNKNLINIKSSTLDINQCVIEITEVNQSKQTLEAYVRENSISEKIVKSNSFCIKANQS